jgi:DnaJ homolog subfamily A member 2
LDGKSIKIASFPGECLKDGEIKLLKGMGMPFFKDNMNFGNLYVEFDIKFPKKGEISKEQAAALKKILPQPKQVKLAEGVAEDDKHLL